VYILTQGGPGTATETISYFSYVIGFKQFHLGLASAASYFLLIVIIVISTIYIKLLRGQFQE
jgi:ABC-type sugar transport system permease subunit